MLLDGHEWTIALFAVGCRVTNTMSVCKMMGTNMGNACASFLQDAGETSGAEGTGVVGSKFTYSLTPRPWTL